jgi:hypothetical protein
MYQGVKPWLSASDGKFIQWGEYRISANSLDMHDEDFYFIGSVINVNDSGENEANARLISEAPNMLAALRRAALALAFAAESSAAMRDDYEAVSKAIARATGATHE